jgi:cell division protein FtsQ
MGNNIFTVEPQAAAERLAALPMVLEATVWPELPDRLVIRITERQPVLIWQIGNDRFLVDTRGVVMALNPPAERSQNLPTVTVRDVEAPTVGGEIDGAIVTRLLILVRRAPEYGLPVAALDYSAQSGIVLHLDNERTILFGEGARLEEQLAVAAAVAASENRWTVLNVTDPDRPFFPVR